MPPSCLLPLPHPLSPQKPLFLGGTEGTPEAAMLCKSRAGSPELLSHGPWALACPFLSPDGRGIILTGQVGKEASWRNMGREGPWREARGGARNRARALRPPCRISRRTRLHRASACTCHPNPCNNLPMSHGRQRPAARVWTIAMPMSKPIPLCQVEKAKQGRAGGVGGQ